MKNALVAATLLLLVGSAPTEVQAGSDKAEPGQNPVAEYAGDLPHILNDRPWVDTCSRDRNSCDYTGSTKPPGGHS